MKRTTGGVLCDTESATLIAFETSGGNLEGPAVGEEFSWNRTSLYRTILGRFFVCRELVGGMFVTMQLLGKGEAMDLYGSLPD